MRKIIAIVFSTVSLSCLAQIVTFTGFTDNSWHRDCNWSPEVRPICTDSAVIPTGKVVNVSGIAHCKKLDLQGTATINITGAGKLEISDTDACVGTQTPSSGCTVPGSAWSGNGGTTGYHSFSEYCFCPCINIGPETLFKTFSNNTSYDITINLPNMSCAVWFGGSTKIIPAGGSINVGLQAFHACCPEATGMGTWTSTDGGSGTFLVESTTI